MPRSPSSGARVRAFTVMAGLAALGLLGPSIADACGGFFRSNTIPAELQPSLSREKVLLIHDAKAGRQHFIREVAFARASEPFGFVVPTPTRPEVAEVEKTPFTQLRTQFPFAPVPRGRGGEGSKTKGGSPGVSVLEVKTVGSFTAFVLAATDADALAGWLADNELVSSKQADAWLAHYVDMGFYYVALRYDPPADSPRDGKVTAETMRISFASPIPYYPYLEPEAPAKQTERRLLELWVVGTESVVPVARGERLGKQRWIRPLAAGEATLDARGRLEAALEPELEALLPEGPLVLQTFQDQKRSRASFGDILFAYEQAHELTPKEIAALTPLLGILDPELVEKEVK